MPKIFRQRDIDQMQASDISQEFVDYYNRLSEERKSEFAENRPDLFSALQAWESSETNSAEEDGDDYNYPEEVLEESIDPEPAEEKDDTADFSAIIQNAYDGVNIPKLIKDDFRPIEALVIKDSYEKCPAHRIPLIKYNPKFHNERGAILGMVFYYCQECNRLFIKQSRYEPNKQNLENWDIPYNFYDMELSAKYLKSQTEPYVIGSEEKIYVPEQWIEEKPTCPIHECVLEELPCVMKYGNEAISFDAYFCPECKKVVMRRTGALSLEDHCAEIGIPFSGVEVLAKKTPRIVAVPRREVKPDYVMDDGKRTKYSFAHIADCYKLTESDTVVVSDSVYCTLDGHNTETVLGLIWVKEKAGGIRKSYLFMLGYCSECQKYYMDESDYKTIYKIGRPEVTLLMDTTDDSYMITSGEVFNLEAGHLKELENKISSEESGIHSQPDYVSQYATISGYDDGGLSYAKSVSRQKYEPRLTLLYSYKGRPYQYRVDISSESKTEVYYVGSADIVLNNTTQVISANSRLGRELIHYQTIKVKKDDQEYDIKLSRQFDINDATLYGYANLRTDEDIIFRKGITDPFLVRVLNMRKRQHNLIDIFVTIQENQNTIVDAQFDKNLIVQGCAGSGKTMVMLHRLSSLKYNRPDFNFSRDALILTPNEHFTLHIKDLAESLQIGTILRTSVEQYYSGLLSEYSSELKPPACITSEMSVKQIFVDYIYSDEFRTSFEENYIEIIEKRNQLIGEVQTAAELMEEKARNIDTSVDSTVIPQLKSIASSLISLINTTKKRCTDAAAALKDIQERKARMAIEIPEKKKFASGMLKESAPRAKTKALAALVELQGSIDERNEKLISLQTEKEELDNDTASQNSPDKTNTFKEFISSNQKWVNSAITGKLTAINENQAEVKRKSKENEHLLAALSIPVEEVLHTGTSEDTELTAILSKLGDERKKRDIILQEKTRIENSWITLGKTRRLAEIGAQLEAAGNAIAACENEVAGLYNMWRDLWDGNASEIEALQSEMASIEEEIREQISLNKKKRLSELSRQITRLKNLIQTDMGTIEARLDAINQLNDGTADHEIVAWIKRISEFAPDAEDELKLYNRLSAETAQYEAVYAGMDEKIEAAQHTYDAASAKCYPAELEEMLTQLNDEIAAYSDLKTYQMIFDATVAPFKAQHGIKNNNSKYHRYDLYAQLIFAKKFYNKTVSEVRFMCVDEGQDLALNEYRLICELNSHNVIFNIFGDTNQLIKANRGINNWEALKTIFKAEEYTLNENYRNTNQITRFCNDSFGMSMLQTGVDGAKVREITRKEFNSEISDLQITTERVAVLLPRNVQKKKYMVAVPSQEKISDKEIENGKIAVMYVDEVKGIEFDKVYVISARMARNEKYIAYTRALTELIVVVDESLIE